MPDFLIAETQSTTGRLFVLWRRDPSGAVTVLPWASRSRRDVQGLHGSVMELEADGLDPSAQAGVIEAGLEGRAEGRPQTLVDLDEDEREAIARVIAREIRAADDRPSGMLHRVDTDVLILVGRHLVSAP
jgi:hypothetical protein